MMRKAILVLAGLGLISMLGSSVSVKGEEDDDCSAKAAKRADKVVKVLDDNGAATTRVSRPFGDRCLGESPTQTHTLSLRQFWTHDHKFYQLFIWPSGTRRYLSFTHHDNAHVRFEIAWQCYDGGARVSKFTDQFLPLGPLPEDPYTYSNAINDVETLNIGTVDCSTCD